MSTIRIFLKFILNQLYSAILVLVTEIYISHLQVLGCGCILKYTNWWEELICQLANLCVMMHIHLEHIIFPCYIGGRTSIYFKPEQEKWICALLVNLINIIKTGRKVIMCTYGLPSSLLRWWKFRLYIFWLVSNQGQYKICLVINNYGSSQKLYSPFQHIIG